MTFLNSIYFLAILFIIELIYFKVAIHFRIVDRPNERSSHRNTTIRGGGIIFPIAMLSAIVYFKSPHIYFLIGLILISIISFIDDLNPVSSAVRLIIHLLSVGLLIVDIGILALPIYWILICVILYIGIINAINFMDGINGITSGYALITLITLFCINHYLILFIEEYLITASIVSVGVFSFFNFRNKAKCFAGDVGSISVAFILIFFISKLILATGNYYYIFLLTIYGLDTLTTIIFRIIKRENIFAAHRSHFYQFLANEKQIPHIYVSLLYALIQLAINFLLFIVAKGSVFITVTILCISTLFFIFLRFNMEGAKRLLRTK